MSRNRINRVAFILTVALASSQAAPQFAKRPEPSTKPAGESPAVPVVPAAPAQTPPADYVLGADDQVTLWTPEADELNGKAVRIDKNGSLTIPLIGSIKASGMTPSQLSTELSKRLERYYQNPEVVVSVSEYHSQPVSIIGAVNTPGVHQLQGQKTLVEMLSLAGGLRQDAGPTVIVTRRAEWGPIPIANAKIDPSKGFSTAEIDLKSVTSAERPVDNIAVKPNDIISVPRAHMVYVMGEVERTGGFVVNERKGVSVLQALSLAGGLKSTAAPKNARILRPTEQNAAREEVPVNLPEMLAGKGSDMDLRPDDILFIPNSRAKKAAIRAAEAAIQTLTGVVIWRGSR
jgi:polysaccharide biosynthesis/export protein